MRRVAIVMAGGSGERFWPVSRASRPKQLLRLTSPEHSLLEQAVLRVRPLLGTENVYVATGKSVLGAIRTASVVPESNLLCEPAKRNTLGCLCWAAANWIARGESEVAMAVLTADHDIREPDRFAAAVVRALETAESTAGLVTIGVPPTRPETGYGYIELSDSSASSAGFCRIESFREKPDDGTAKAFLASNRFLWNSGMFFWTLAAFLSALERSQPEAARITAAMAEMIRREDAAGAETAFESLPNVSIDYAIMESEPNSYVLKADFPWDDVGAWDALSRTLPLDEAGNATSGDALIVDSRDSIIFNDSPGTVVGALGLDGLVVVVSEDAVLVCRKDQVQRAREIVERLRGRGGDHL